MCGINAVYKHTKINPDDLNKLSGMIAEMPYRGPDESGVWQDDRVAFGHLRLSILGVEDGRQPLMNENRTIVMICNGEIYNYVALKEELIQKGHQFSTNSDSEVIIHLYEEKGVECLQDLRGMFAFCLWDKKQETFFVARDRIGQKPLYYHQTGSGLVFSSELKAIAKSYRLIQHLDYEVIRQTLKYSYPLSQKDTFLSEIKRIKPGEYLIINKQKFQFKKYWVKQNKTTFSGSLATAATKTKELLLDAVDVRLQSEVPVAILLSGGIDSSAIACLAKKIRKEVHVISIGYKEGRNVDERNDAKRLADDIGLIWHEIEIDEQDYLTYFEEYITILDEPVADTAAIAQWALYKKAKALGFTVLLSGNGGDEIFYGYPLHNKMAEIRGAFHNIEQHLPIYSLKKLFHLLYAILKFVPYLPSIPFNWHSQHWTIPEKIITNHTHSFFLNKNSFESDKGLTAIEQAYNFLFNTWLINNCLFLSDKLGMGNSTEIRTPFIDHLVVEFIATLPIKYKYNPSINKYLLKEAMKGIVPSYVFNRPKKGFTPPPNYINSIIKKYAPHSYSFGELNFNSLIINKQLHSLGVTFPSKNF